MVHSPWQETKPVNQHISVEDISSTVIDGYQAVLSLFKAATSGDAAELEHLLLSASLVRHISCEDAEGWTPLHHAVDGNHLAAAKVLVSCAAGINAANAAGDTPLHLALRWSFVEIASFLLAQPGIAVAAQVRYSNSLCQQYSQVSCSNARQASCSQ